MAINLKFAAQRPCCAPHAMFSYKNSNGFSYSAKIQHEANRPQARGKLKRAQSAINDQMQAHYFSSQPYQSQAGNEPSKLLPSSGTPFAAAQQFQSNMQYRAGPQILAAPPTAPCINADKKPLRSKKGSCFSQKASLASTPGHPSLRNSVGQHSVQMKAINQSSEDELHTPQMTAAKKHPQQSSASCLRNIITACNSCKSKPSGVKSGNTSVKKQTLSSTLALQSRHKSKLFKVSTNATTTAKTTTVTTAPTPSNATLTSHQLMFGRDTESKHSEHASNVLLTTGAKETTRESRYLRAVSSPQQHQQSYLLKELSQPSKSPLRRTKAKKQPLLQVVREPNGIPLGSRKGSNTRGGGANSSLGLRASAQRVLEMEERKLATRNSGRQKSHLRRLNTVEVGAQSTKNRQQVFARGAVDVHNMRSLSPLHPQNELQSEPFEISPLRSTDNNRSPALKIKPNYPPVIGKASKPLTLADLQPQPLVQPQHPYTVQPTAARLNETPAVATENGSTRDGALLLSNEHDVPQSSFEADITPIRVADITEHLTRPMTNPHHVSLSSTSEVAKEWTKNETQPSVAYPHDIVYVKQFANSTESIQRIKPVVLLSNPRLREKTLKATLTNEDEKHDELAQRRSPRQVEHRIIDLKSVSTSLLSNTISVKHLDSYKNINMTAGSRLDSNSETCQLQTNVVSICIASQSNTSQVPVNQHSLEGQSLKNSQIPSSLWTKQAPSSNHPSKGSKASKGVQILDSHRMSHNKSSFLSKVSGQHQSAATEFASSLQQVRIEVGLHSMKEAGSRKAPMHVKRHSLAGISAKAAQAKTKRRNQSFSKSITNKLPNSTSTNLKPGESLMAQSPVLSKNTKKFSKRKTSSHQASDMLATISRQENPLIQQSIDQIPSCDPIVPADFPSVPFAIALVQPEAKPGQTRYKSPMQSLQDPLPREPNPLISVTTMSPILAHSKKTSLLQSSRSSNLLTNEQEVTQNQLSFWQRFPPAKLVAQAVVADTITARQQQEGADPAKSLPTGPQLRQQTAAVAQEPKHALSRNEMPAKIEGKKGLSKSFSNMRQKVPKQQDENSRGRKKSSKMKFNARETITFGQESISQVSVSQAQSQALSKSLSSMSKKKPKTPKQNKAKYMQTNYVTPQQMADTRPSQTSATSKFVNQPFNRGVPSPATAKLIQIDVQSLDQGPSMTFAPSSAVKPHKPPQQIEMEKNSPNFYLFLGDVGSEATPESARSFKSSLHSAAYMSKSGQRKIHKQRGIRSIKSGEDLKQSQVSSFLPKDGEVETLKIRDLLPEEDEEEEKSPVALRGEKAHKREAGRSLQRPEETQAHNAAQQANFFRKLPQVTGDDQVSCNSQSTFNESSHIVVMKVTKRRFLTRYHSFEDQRELLPSSRAQKTKTSQIKTARSLSQKKRSFYSRFLTNATHASQTAKPDNLSHSFDKTKVLRINKSWQVQEDSDQLLPESTLRSQQNPLTAAIENDKPANTEAQQVETMKSPQAISKRQVQNWMGTPEQSQQHQSSIDKTPALFDYAEYVQRKLPGMNSTESNLLDDISKEVMSVPLLKTDDPSSVPPQSAVEVEETKQEVKKEGIDLLDTVLADNLLEFDHVNQKDDDFNLWDDDEENLLLDKVDSGRNDEVLNMMDQPEDLLLLKSPTAPQQTQSPERVGKLGLLEGDITCDSLAKNYLTPTIDRPSQDNVLEFEFTSNGEGKPPSQQHNGLQHFMRNSTNKLEALQNSLSIISEEKSAWIMDSVSCASSKKSHIHSKGLVASSSCFNSGRKDPLANTYMNPNLLMRKPGLTSSAEQRQLSELNRVDEDSTPECQGSPHLRAPLVRQRSGCQPFLVEQLEKDAQHAQEVHLTETNEPECASDNLLSSQTRFNQTEGDMKLCELLQETPMTSESRPSNPLEACKQDSALSPSDLL